MNIDLNADMGEDIGDDAALLELVSSANIACGLHAGGALTMARVMAEARARGVGIGAHPGFEDRANFGRSRMQLAPEELRALIRYQLGAARAMGHKIAHFKLHGALNNMACEDYDLARTAFETALSIDRDLILVVLPCTQMERAARDLGARLAGEIFADRAYEPNGLLRDRGLSGAVLHDAGAITARMVAMLRAGAILPEGAPPIPAQIDTICVHGDSPDAVKIVRHLRAGLEAAGVTIAPMQGRSIGGR